ncbi:hypothetical protein IAQ61_002511 [Plenodomus lingam]|uniref:Predicted protein n=1 Tax=Leptosphaeria maculans (strain JN3 / isolate v23.1.3 / race Av1-4-5-6-7-8) TaxID=985895 RepID=E4ZIM5_LEPMJ|nr:predicted protein [Plenodomus lingam JN3]KAH9877148.1 hypothetical protein IAQ61_002511 [Plenodomus lingam]CBX91046.1 predicted protein [Plenodomus lingam JN3]
MKSHIITTLLTLPLLALSFRPATPCGTNQDGSSPCMRSVDGTDAGAGYPDHVNKLHHHNTPSVDPGSEEAVLLRGLGPVVWYGVVERGLELGTKEGAKVWGKTGFEVLVTRGVSSGLSSGLGLVTSSGSGAGSMVTSSSSASSSSGSGFGSGSAALSSPSPNPPSTLVTMPKMTTTTTTTTITVSSAWDGTTQSPHVTLMARGSAAKAARVQHCFWRFCFS